MRAAAPLLVFALMMAGCVSSPRHSRTAKPEQRGVVTAADAARRSRPPDPHVDNWQGAYEAVQRVAKHGE